MIPPPIPQGPPEFPPSLCHLPQNSAGSCLGVLNRFLCPASSSPPGRDEVSLVTPDQPISVPNVLLQFLQRFPLTGDLRAFDKMTDNHPSSSQYSRVIVSSLIDSPLSLDAFRRSLGLGGSPKESSHPSGISTRRYSLIQSP